MLVLPSDNLQADGPRPLRSAVAMPWSNASESNPVQATCLWPVPETSMGHRSQTTWGGVCGSCVTLTCWMIPAHDIYQALRRPAKSGYGRPANASRLVSGAASFLSQAAQALPGQGVRMARQCLSLVKLTCEVSSLDLLRHGDMGSGRPSNRILLACLGKQGLLSCKGTHAQYADMSDMDYQQFTEGAGKTGASGSWALNLVDFCSLLLPCPFMRM